MKKTKTSKFKVGGTAIMLFHMFGLISEEKHKILEIKKDILTLDTDEDETKCKKFHIPSGACINDDNWGGAKRTLKI